MSARIAYLVNQYPKVSHSFIRREILALEARGVTILRISLRGWDAPLVDPEDERERKATRYVLRQGIGALVGPTLLTAMRRPSRFLRALALVLQIAHRSRRSLPYHLAYLAEACTILNWLEKFGASHLHAHFGTNPAEVAMLTRALGGPTYSFTVHGPEEFDDPEGLGLGEKIKRAAFVVAISSYGRAQLMRWSHHEDWGKIEVVRCGVDPSFHDAPAQPFPDAPRIVCVGRLCEQKGQLLLIQAAARLAAQGIAFQLVLAGDGEMRPEIEASVARHNLADSVRITGWVDGTRIKQEILAARALVLPSFAEGLPVVIMEALALRRPVVTTHVAGIPELVEHGRNGWLVPAGDVDVLVEGLKDALTRSPEELAQMGEDGRLAVLQRHAIDAQAGRLLGCIRGPGTPMQQDTSTGQCRR